MSERKTYLYRLDVVYPEGSHDENGRVNRDWRPDNWTEDHPHFQFIHYSEEFPDEPHGFVWPGRRRCISGSGAARVARRLESYGATVTIVRSEPVVWPEVPDA